MKNRYAVKVRDLTGKVGYIHPRYEQMVSVPYWFETLGDAQRAFSRRQFRLEEYVTDGQPI